MTNKSKSREDLIKDNESFEVKYKRYIRLLENAMDMIYRMSLPEGIYEYVSPASKQIFGYEPEVFYNSPSLIQESIHPDFKQYFQKEWRNLLNDKMPVRYEYKIIHKSGEERWLNQRNVLIKDDNGKPAAIEGIVTDITERKKIELKLKQKNEEYEALNEEYTVQNEELKEKIEELGAVEEELRANNEELADLNKDLRKKERILKEAQKIAQLGHWELDIVNNKLDWSDEIYRIFDLEPQQFKATYEAFLESIHPDDREMVNKAYTDSLNNKKPYQIEHRLLLKDKKIKYVLERCHTIYDKNGRPLHSIGTVQDITDQKRKRKIKEAQFKLYDFFENHSTKDLLQKFLDETEALTASKIGFYHFVEDDQKTLSLWAWSTNTLQNMCNAEGEGAHYNIDEAGVWVDCVKVRKPVIHNDYESLKEKKGLPEGHAPVIRELVVPVIRENKIVAILGVGNKETDYNEVDVYIVQELADAAWDTVIRKKTQEKLEKSEEKYRELLENLNAAVVVHDSQTKIIYSNSKASELLDLTEEQIPEKNAIDPNWYFFREDNSIMPLEEFPVNIVLKTKMPLKNYVVGLNRPIIKDQIWVLVNAYPVFEEKKLDHIVVTFIDITERKTAQIKLENTINELERSNKELEQFAYVASHDLQEPLRKVKNFTELFAKKYSGIVDEKANQYINYITTGADRMQTLVLDLLSLSRVSTRGKEFVPTDLNETVKKVTENLQLSIEEYQAQLVIDELPLLMVDESQMIQVFQNLIGNSIKFKSDIPPVIKIGAEENNNNWKFSISDNGIGMDMKYKEKIFEVFQRLHTKEEYAGTGIGLAICKKIIERHKGTIWIESELRNLPAGRQGGSTFYFTIPKKLKDYE